MTFVFMEQARHAQVHVFQVAFDLLVVKSLMQHANKLELR
jgi:hypothetical protein